MPDQKRTKMSADRFGGGRSSQRTKLVVNDLDQVEELLEKTIRHRTIGKAEAELSLRNADLIQQPVLL